MTKKLQDIISTLPNARRRRIGSRASALAAQKDRTAKAIAKAEDVLGDAGAAAKWFQREIRSLGGVTPASMMDSDSGFESVIKTLQRIEFGVVS